MKIQIKSDSFHFSGTFGNICFRAYTGAWHIINSVNRIYLQQTRVFELHDHGDLRSQLGRTMVLFLLTYTEGPLEQHLKPLVAGYKILTQV